MAKKKLPESSLYPLVERWLRRRFGCFKTSVNKGLRTGRIDIVGVRDVGGDLSGAVETIGIEVKRGSFPFSNACGQTLSYNVYVNRTYLADLRNERFTTEQIQIASHLGIGLIQIKGKTCTEILSSPFYDPIERLNLMLLERLRLGRCQLCHSVFNIGVASENRYSRVTREKVEKAIDEGKGMMFWNHEVAARKHKVGLRLSVDGTAFERRFICADCVTGVLAQFALYRDSK